MESEREELAARSKALAIDETKIAAEKASLNQEQEFVCKEQERLSELAKKIQSEMTGIESFSKVGNAGYIQQFYGIIDILYIIFI